MSRFFNAVELSRLLMLANDDYLQRSKGRLLSYSKYVWQDMNITTVKQVKRQYMHIDKRTNRIIMPDNFLQISSINIVDECGNIYPVYRYDNVRHDDIVDVSATKNCGCELSCGYQLCNTIKGYEAIVSTKEDKNPDGSTVSFTCVDRIGLGGGGFLYKETQYPKRIYTDGEWTSTILYTEQQTLCQLDVDERGCVCDTEKNVDSCCDSCGIKGVNTNQCCIGGTANCPPMEKCDEWIYYCNSKMEWFWTQCGSHPNFRKHCNNHYNISELGDSLIFPHNFGWDKVLVRYFVDDTVDEIRIPAIAIDTFIMGLKWWDCRFNDKKQALAEVYGKSYTKLKFGLIREMNKYRIAELGQIFCPPAYVPSYVYDQKYLYWNNGYFNGTNIVV